MSISCRSWLLVLSPWALSSKALCSRGSPRAASLKFSSFRLGFCPALWRPLRPDAPRTWCASERGCVCSLLRPCPAASAPASCSPAARRRTRPPSERRWRCTTSSSLTSTPSKVQTSSFVLPEVPVLGSDRFHSWIDLVTDHPRQSQKEGGTPGFAGSPGCGVPSCGVGW